MLMAETNPVKILEGQLCQYGLNPTEWRIYPVSSRLYAIQNRSDQMTYFWGSVKILPDRLSWQQLLVAI